MNDPIREALQLQQSGDEPPNDLLRQLTASVPAPLLSRREPFLWLAALLLLAGLLAVVTFWGWGIRFPVESLPTWAAPLLAAAALHAVWPTLFKHLE